MKYNEPLANRVREKLIDYPSVEEKWMFGSLAFMVAGKLCICVQKDGLLVRTDPARRDELLEQNGCREMIHGSRTMKGYLYIDESVLQTGKEFNYWTGLALDYNSRAKALGKVPSSKKR